jgi:class 3 adenylate cyclase
MSLELAGWGWSLVRCPGCRHENPDEARFCSQCGAPLGSSCGTCGVGLPPGARFCLECGSPVTAARVPASYTPRHVSEQILAVRSAMEGERKQVTVLFCDIVSSSALAAKLGPEEFHLVIERFFEAAVAEVHRYEGTVNQFLGDGFMALFGAPIACEDHARRAVLAALGIVAQSELRVRIGINSGLVVVGTIGDDLRVDYTAFGDTTVLAARLQAAAEPGAMLISQHTAELVRGYFQVEEVAPVQVKERTVYPVKVTGLGTRTARITSGNELSPFSGRDRELAELQRVLEVAADGEGQVVGLVGDPGLGKSRLAWEFCQLAGPHAAVLEGRCQPYGASIAYLPLFELVRNACGIAADDPPDLVGAKIERKVKALELDVSLAHYLRHAFGVPADDPAVAAPDPAAIRARTFEALRRLLVALVGQRPLVVLIEDLHWIDQTSEEFLAGFTRHRGGLDPKRTTAHLRLDHERQRRAHRDDRRPGRTPNDGRHPDRLPPPAPARH